MKRTLSLIALIITPLSAQASGVFISPEVKVGSFRGAGIQFGTNDTLPFSRVVGVVKDFHQRSLYEPIESLLLWVSVKK